MELHNKKVRLLWDIEDEDENILVKEGTTFIWNDSSIEQLVEGEFYVIGEDEVEVVD